MLILFFICHYKFLWFWLRCAVNRNLKIKEITTKKTKSKQNQNKIKIHELSGSFKDCNVNQKKNHAAYIAKCKGRALDGAWSAVREKKRAPADQLIGARRLVLFTNTLLVVFFFFFFT